jgi:hypothetical protein
MRGFRGLFGPSIVVLAAVLAGAAAVRLLRPAADPPPPAWADDYDLSARPPEEIAPGTVVARGPPAGWSHLVIKSLPRVKASEVADLPKSVVPCDMLVRRVAWMFTAFTADVVEERQGAHRRHRLRAIGLGLGAAVNGRDTVLTVDWAGNNGVGLDPIERLTLRTAARVQNQARVVVHGPSFALTDTPVTFRCGEKRNRAVRFRYALLADPPTGRLDVLCWRLGAEGGGCADLTRAVLLNPDTIDAAELLADRSGFDLMGVPGELAFGVDALPPHRLAVALPPPVSALAGKTRYTPDEAHALERGLRALLPDA